MNRPYDDELQHYGVRGMKWGVQRIRSKTVGLDVKVKKQIRRYDRGKNVSKDELARLSKKVRRHKYNIERKVARANRFIIKSEKSDVKALVYRYNRDPLKKAAVQEYMDNLKANRATLDELRLQLMDVRI